MVVYSVCCSNCGVRVEVQNYDGVEKVLCPGCQKIEETREIADCGKCKSRVCERGEK